MKNWLQALLLILVGMLASAILFLVVSPPRGSAVELLPAPTPAPLMVHVDGAVKNPGVYTLPRESRVREAVEAAGGLRPEANQSAINLAARVKDGEKLTIPIIGTPEAPLPTQAPTERKSKAGITPAGTPDQPVNLNTATLEELQTLTGIGPTRAQQIIDYRQAHGGFKSIDEIQNVSGIGPATFEKLKDHITVE